MTVSWWSRSQGARKHVPHAVERGTERTLCGLGRVGMEFVTTGAPAFAACPKCLRVARAVGTCGR